MQVSDSFIYESAPPSWSSAGTKRPERESMEAPMQQTVHGGAPMQVMERGHGVPPSDPRFMHMQHQVNVR